MDKQQDLSDSSMDDMDLSPLEDSGEVELLAELADPTGLTSAEDPEEESEEDLQDLHLQGEKRVAAKKGAIPALAERNRPWAIRDWDSHCSSQIQHYSFPFFIGGAACRIVTYLQLCNFF